MTQAEHDIDAAATHTTTTEPPRAARRAHTHDIHGDARTDDYYWLREKSDPEVIRYLEAENAYTEAVMRPTADLQERLYREMVGRIKETDLSVPYREGAYLYYARTEEGKQYPIYCRRFVATDGDADAAEQVMLDLNELATGLDFLAVGDAEVSPDGELLAYTLDTTGFREYTLRCKNLTTGEIAPYAVEKVSSVAWANDNRTVFYVVDDAAKRPYRLYRHTLGTEASADELIQEESDEKFHLQVSRARSGGYVFITSASHTASEVRYVPADEPLCVPLLIEPRAPEHEYYVEHHGDSFYIRTNRDAKNFRLVVAPASASSASTWRELVPHRADVMLEDVDCFAHFYVLTERAAGLPRLRVVDLESRAAHDLEFPDPVYSAHLEHNREFATAAVRFSYQSFTTPPSVFDYDVETHARTLLKQTEVRGGFDPTQYVSSRLYATAPDGARVPLAVVHRRDVQPGAAHNAHPLLLEAYGSYGYPYPITFSSARLSLLDRGVFYAVAHIRGGGDLGKVWHDQGRLKQKRNTFTDFIVAAEHLIKEGYTTPQRLVITGGSAGGLLMGAVVNLRPDLFRAVLSKVPFVDVLTTMLDAGLPLTVGEYEEWGDPNVAEDYAYMKTYSPYDNLAPGVYPAMLVKTALNDSQVMYWEPAKYVARLRTLKTDERPMLLKTNLGAGHGGASGRYDHLREVAFDYAFILSQLEIEN